MQQGSYDERILTNSILQVAAKAVIINNDRQVLLVRESTYVTNTQSGKYGIPGGRLGPGEAFVDGLRREAQEETGLFVEPIQPLYVGEWRPVIKGVQHQVIAIFMLCRASSFDVRLGAEHEDFAWISQKEAPRYVIMPPDDAVLERYWNTKANT